MVSVLAATMFLLAFLVLPGSISRLVGAKFAAMFLATTGVFVLPVILGPTWRAALAAGFDIALLLAGARLASRFGSAQAVCAIWITRIAAVISSVLFVFFAALALMVASLADRAVDALPYDFLALISGIVFVSLVSRRQLQRLAHSFARTLVSVPLQA